VTFRMHTVVGLFRTNDFRCHCLLRDLTTAFRDVRFFVVWDHYAEDSHYDFRQFADLQSFERDELFDSISRAFGVDRLVLARECEQYRLFLRMLLLLHLRRTVGLEYCVMTDDDVYAFDPIDEIVALSARQTPFLIQEVYSSDNIGALGRFIMNDLGREIHYRPPNKGMGYNVGLCGLDLTVFDSIDAETFEPLMTALSGVDPWAKDQSFLVLMTFTSPKAVHTFETEKYLFLHCDDPNYRAKSKLLHCIGTADKRLVDLWYARRYGSVPKRLASILALEARRTRSWIAALRPRLRIRSRIRQWLGVGNQRERVPVLNANRYEHLIEHVKHNSCERILEIGVWKGDTAEALIRNSKNPKVEYHGIDVFEDSNPELLTREWQGGMKADRANAVRRRLARASKRVVLHKGLSSDVYAELARANLKFDLIWIDGGHSYETVKFDFENYAKLLSADGMVFLDDYTEDPYLPDVKRYIDREILSNSRLQAQVHEEHSDQYRGYDYHVVSVRLKHH